jgi:hypothetical protein
MKSVKIAVLILLSLSFYNSFAQEKKFAIHTVAFYNLENLFDTINDPTINDEASPIMEASEALRAEIYKKKLDNMANVVADIGSDISNNSPAVIGVCEIENRQVLYDLINHPALLNKDYGVVHFDSPDRRGIDVALLYQKRLFRPINTSSHELVIFDSESRERRYTRDQLLVSGELDGDLIHLIVNHWPSRGGGEARSRPGRIAAAKLNKHLADSLFAIDPYAKIITMGDFNDNPTDYSFKKTLKTVADRDKVGLKELYNPYENMYKSGLGTTGYRDIWSLFDQIVISQSLTDRDYTSYRFYQAGIHNKAYLTNKRGRWKGYPWRSFSDGGFSGGYSDHFPVYIYLIKEVE